MEVFVFTASIRYGLAMFVIAIASNFNGFLIGMAISGLGFGVRAAVGFAPADDALPEARPQRQGSRRSQHRQRPPLHHSAGVGASHPGDRRR